MGPKKNLRWDEMDKSGMELEQLGQYFEVYNKSEGKSAKTIKWYAEALGGLIKWLRATGRPTVLGDVGELQVREFVLWLQEKPTARGGKLSTHTISNRVRALRAFFNWLHWQGYTEEHLLKRMRPPRLPQLVVEPLTDDEVARLFRHLDPGTGVGARNIAILALFLDTGLRLSELVSVTLEDLHMDEQYVKVRGKGNKERIIPFGASVQKVLLRYLLHFRPEEAHSGVRQLFLSIDGSPITGEAVRSFLRRLGRIADVPRLHPHLLRHSYATDFLLNGGDVLLLKHNLGHTTLVMVDQYVHLASRKAAIASRSFSPLDRMSIKELRRRSSSRKPRHR